LGGKIRSPGAKKRKTVPNPLVHLGSLRDRE
jgi:hypothetical protein